jgi:hypothetical protein
MPSRKFIEYFPPLLFGFSCAFLLFVYWLQVPVLSIKRQAALLACFFIFSAFFYFAKKEIARRFADENFFTAKKLALAFFISAVLMPFIPPQIDYPSSLFFQKEVAIKVTVEFDESVAPADRIVRRLWLETAGSDKKYNQNNFTFSSEWRQGADGYVLIPQTRGDIFWKGKLGDRIMLIVDTKDVSRSVTVSLNESKGEVSLVQNPSYFREKIAVPQVFFGLATLSWLLFTSTIFFLFFDLIYFAFRQFGARPKRALIIALILSVDHENAT